MRISIKFILEPGALPSTSQDTFVKLSSRKIFILYTNIIASNISRSESSFMSLNVLFDVIKCFF